MVILNIDGCQKEHGGIIDKELKRRLKERRLTRENVR